MEASTDLNRDDLVRLRDTDQLSWAKVARALGLGSPGAARRAYSSQVRPHTESVLATRSATNVQPLDLNGADLDAVREAITGRTIVVTRKHGTEDIHVAKVTSAKGGNVTFNDGDKTRTVKLAAITAAK
ncbi:MAG: hypothetical protein ACK5OX_08790 [Desertimonas sp.]